MFVQTVYSLWLFLNEKKHSSLLLQIFSIEVVRLLSRGYVLKRKNFHTSSNKSEYNLNEKSSDD